ncbi:MAG: YggW family oxidoreductase, partial [Gammaproteobacteria bacterium]
GFSNYNIDLMYGLPKQTVDDALFDLQEAISFSPPHLSWYHLTLEPNTVFYTKPPKNLPSDKCLIDIEKTGREFLADKNYQRYEISAYAKSNRYSRHNYNYWEFGDYLGIGAGAHGKITDLTSGTVKRLWKLRTPKTYLNNEQQYIGGQKTLTSEDLKLEFLMNGLRLIKGIEIKLFTERTGLDFTAIETQIRALKNENLLYNNNESLQLTEQGLLFLDEILARFV